MKHKYLNPAFQVQEMQYSSVVLSLNIFHQGLLQGCWDTLFKYSLGGS